MALLTGANIDLGGKSAIVTGGTRGIGLVIAKTLLMAGCKVAVCARNTPVDLPDGIGFYTADVRDFEQVKAFVDLVAKKHGGLDILVNNAGGSPQAQAIDSGVRFIDSILRLNLVAPLYMSQAAYPQMKNGGSIINIASVSGIRPSPGTSVYGAAKAGLLNLTQSLAQEWGPDGIRVNAIIAGLMATETSAETYGDKTQQEQIGKSMPLQRMGQGQDIANAILWLASDLSNWVSGARINVDGGGEKPYFLDVVNGG